MPRHFPTARRDRLSQILRHIVLTFTPDQMTETIGRGEILPRNQAMKRLEVTEPQPSEQDYTTAAKNKLQDIEVSVWKQSLSECELKLADFKQKWRRSVWRSVQNADSRHQTANRIQNGDCRNIKECLSVQRAWNEYRWRRIGEFLQGKAMRCWGLFSCYRIVFRSH